MLPCRYSCPHETTHCFHAKCCLASHSPPKIGGGGIFRKRWQKSPVLYWPISTGIQYCFEYSLLVSFAAFMINLQRIPSLRTLTRRFFVRRPTVRIPHPRLLLPPSKCSFIATIHITFLFQSIPLAAMGTMTGICLSNKMGPHFVYCRRILSLSKMSKFPMFQILILSCSPNFFNKFRAHVVFAA